MKLPIPTLEQTRENFKNHARAYESFDEKLITQSFESNAMQKLQNLLLVYDRDQSSSYLHRLWNDSYLSTREPLSIASNFSLKLPFKLDLEALIGAMSSLCVEYQNQTLEFKNARGNTLFPLQFRILEGACRIPSNQKDTYHLSLLNPNFISVFYQKQLFKLQVLDQKQVLQPNLTSIFKSSKAEVGLLDLSKADSTTAGEIREKCRDYNSFFDVVENSLFSITLIDEEFQDQDSQDFYMHFQAPIYHFKPMSFIYNLKNQEIYLNAEHSFEDGGTIAYILEYLYKHSKPCFDCVAPEATLIEQYIPQDIQNQLLQISQDYDKQVQKIKNQRLSFAVGETYGLSKDFIAQASLVYASHKAYGRFVCQYEAVDMREYDFGRTECVRAVSVEMEKALQSFSKEDFLLANEEHKNRIKTCKKALGLDRHLFALKNFIPCLSQKEQEEVRVFFDSKMYQDVTQTIISTSSLGKSAFVDTFYFHPVHQEGLGICYADFEGSFYYLCTYFQKDAQRFEVLTQALKEFFTKFASLA